MSDRIRGRTRTRRMRMRTTSATSNTLEHSDNNKIETTRATTQDTSSSDKPLTWHHHQSDSSRLSIEDMARNEMIKLRLPVATRTLKHSRGRARESCRPTSAFVGIVVAVVVFCCSSVILQAQVKPLLAHGAVIRPTIFSDLPPEPPANSQQQQQQLQQSQPPQSQSPQSSSINSQAGASQQATNQSPVQPTISSNAAQHHQQHHHYLNHNIQNHGRDGHAHQADGAQPQKINPLKSRFCTGQNGARLDHALGMQSYAIDDLSLSASSFSNEQVRPHLARLNLDNLGGAWCPMKPISSSNFGKEWIQVKLNRSFVVSAIESQGRFALGSGKEFVPSYQIEYSRNNGLTWHKWKDFRGSSLLRANDDANTVVRNELSPPIVGANVIRILPYSQHLRTVCLRFELYGCPYDEGAPVSYSTSDGVVEPRWGHLIDYTYDGLRHRNGQLSGGLGQLVDGVKGPDNFSFNNGFEWVGWKSMNGDLVIEFTFKTLRNFTGALFHSNNLFSSGVEVFQSVDVHYGIDMGLSMDALRDSLYERDQRQQAVLGATGGVLSRAARQSVAAGGGDEPQAPATTVWSSDVLSIEYEPDKKAESSRPVTVHLKQRLANKLRFVLKFASKWILISEVEFLSHPVELMSLASLNEQLTPKLLVELQLARTYDQYVAILREHQLRRIAADEYLQMGGSSTTSTTTTTTGSSVLVDQQQAGDQQQAEQPAIEQQLAVASNRPTPVLSSPDSDDYLSLQLAKRQPPATMLSGYQSGPSTNPLLANQPPILYPSPTNFLGTGGLSPLSASDSQGALFDKINQQTMTSDQQQQRTRTIGLATVISFVFVGIVGLVGVLFAISSYSLRCRSPKLGSPTALPRHATSSAGKAGFMSSVFAAAASADSSGSSGGSSAGSLHNNYRQHMIVGPNHNHSHHHLHGYHHQQQQADSHYNPLFASTSGRSSEASIKKSNGNGPLTTLKKLAALTTGVNYDGEQQHQQENLLFGGGGHQTGAQNQLLVSLKDSISSNGKSGSGSQSQAVSTQLIVGLNQANPLAHQQVYSQQQLYGQQRATAAASAGHYNSTANSSSTTTTTTATNNTNSNQLGGDYATPDIQPIVQSRPLNLHLAGQESFGRVSTRLANAHHHQQRLLMGGGGQLEHNYEQISDQQQAARYNATNTLHHHHHHHHQRTFSNQQQQNQLAGGPACPQQAFNSMTLSSGSFGPNRPTRQHQQQQQQQLQSESSHYYYADTEAAKGCLGNASNQQQQ